MKNLVLLLLVFSSFIIYSCSDNEPLQETPFSIEVLEDVRVLGDLSLPIGTSITKNENGSTINILLPEDFDFISLNNGEIEFYNKSSYTCTCSGENATRSCTVFYNSKVGYGCLQSDCTKTCSGKAGGNENRLTVLGIVNTSNNEILDDFDGFNGSLTPAGYDLFFEVIAKEKISELYEVLYEPYDINSPEELLNSPFEPVFVPVSYMGIQFSLVVPDYSEQKDFQFKSISSGTIVTCTGTATCVCIKKKKCVLGNCIYYCTGCTSCTMSVVEE